MKNILIVLLFASSPVFSSDNQSIQGIWQIVEGQFHQPQPDNAFISIHTRQNQIVLADLKGIETNEHIFSNAYIGSTEDLVLTPISGGWQIKIVLDTDSEADVIQFYNCDGCGLWLPIRIRKIF